MQLCPNAVEQWITRIEEGLAEGFCLTTPRAQFLHGMLGRMKGSAHGLCLTQSQLEQLQHFLPQRAPAPA